MSYIKVLMAFAVSFIMVSCADVNQTILSKKDAVVLVINEGNKGIGTGFFVDENKIVTNNHVVEGGKDLSIKTEHGKIYKVEIINTDSFADIATIKIVEWEDFKKNNKYSLLSFAQDADQMDTVFSIGHPWGLDWSISKGIISSDERLMSAPRFFIQTDAHVFQGNSGGPLLNERGEVVGVNSNMLANQGGSYGMAIPSSLVKKIIHDMEKYKEVRWALIGIMLDENLVKQTDPDQAGAKAGVKNGDIITAIETVNGKFAVNSSFDLISRMAVVDYDNPVTLFIKRGNDDISVVVAPGFKPSSEFETKVQKN